jgi:cytoskeletal protein RodZ
MTEGKLTLGQYFKLEREKRGIELKDIEEKTKISVQILTFLENDRLDLLPPRAFLRGFLQVISKEFDMDSEELIRYLDEALTEYDKTKNLGQMKKGRGKGRLLPVVIILIVVLAIALSVVLCSKRTPETPRQTLKEMHYALSEAGIVQGSMIGLA